MLISVQPRYSTATEQNRYSAFGSANGSKTATVDTAITGRPMPIHNPRLPHFAGVRSDHAPMNGSISTSVRRVSISTMPMVDRPMPSSPP